MCKNNERNTCVFCREEYTNDEMHFFNNEPICDDCFDNETFVCSHCGERFYNNEYAGDEDTALCEDCYDNYYTRCSDCNRLISNDEAYYLDDDYDDEEPYCEDCFDRENSKRYIHDYSYKPDPIFKGNGKRYFGVELEIDYGGKDEYNAEEIFNVANRLSENMYIKTDGSLDEGLELVTHPMTLDYHINNMPWAEVTKKALRLGYRSHNTSTSGLHIHVNRSAFGDTVEEQEDCIARILYFFESNWNELLRFSRRTIEQLQHWANRYGWREEPKLILDNAKQRCSGRYSCVNITNYSTIEFRIFRGTLKYNTIIATLQLVNEICNVAISMSDEEIRNFAWSSFVANIDKESNKELIKYLKERRLYVNEPVEESEEYLNV